MELRGALARTASVVYVVGLVAFCVLRPGGAIDADAYWKVDLANPYTQGIATDGAFLYPPPAAFAFALLGNLPWPVFLFGWTLALGLALLALGGPWTLALALIPAVWLDLLFGNVHALVALALVLTPRYPVAWLLPLLTKPTLGVGLLWYVARREWRNLAIAVGATGAVCLVTFVLRPDLWFGWLEVVTGPAVDRGTLAIPLPLRLIAAGALVWVGARRDWPWVLPIAGAMALPILWPTGVVILVVFGLAYSLRKLDREVVLDQGRGRQRAPVAHHGELQP